LRIDNDIVQIIYKRLYTNIFTERSA